MANPDIANPDIASVARDIFILTSTMHGLRCRSSQPSPKPDHALRLWSNIAFALTTGHLPHDRTVAPVVAVTGFYDGVTIHSSVVARNTPVHEGLSQNRCLPALDVKPVSPGDNARDLLKFSKNITCVIYSKGSIHVQTCFLIATRGSTNTFKTCSPSYATACGPALT